MNDQAEGPHSRACGISKHDHGPRCHRNCPTCHGAAIPETPREFAEPGELATAVIDKWVRTAYAIATSDMHEVPASDPVAQFRWGSLAEPYIPAGRIVAELRKAHLLAETEPVGVTRVFNPLNEEPAEVIAQALTEVLDRLGYSAGCSVTPSLFGGYTVKAAARRKYPSELSDPPDTVKE